MVPDTEKASAEARQDWVVTGDDKGEGAYPRGLGCEDVDAETDDETEGECK